MKVVDYKAMMRFSSDKMQKNEIFATTRLSVDLYCFEAGQAQRSHKHMESDKIYLVLEGTGRFAIGRTTRELKAGMSVLAPAGEEHGVINVTEERLVLLVSSAPPLPAK